MTVIVPLSSCNCKMQHTAGTQLESWIGLDPDYVFHGKRKKPCSSQLESNIKINSFPFRVLKSLQTRKFYFDAPILFLHIIAAFRNKLWT